MEMNVELTRATAREIELELACLDMCTRSGQVKITMNDVNSEVMDLRKDFQILMELMGASARYDAFDQYPNN